MTIQELKRLAKFAVKRQAPENYSVSSVDASLRDGLAELGGRWTDFMRNRFDIYEIIIEAADEYVPKKTLEVIGQFAEVRQVPQGQTAIFRKSLGKNRAKKFLTQVGLSGVYETFRLDADTFPVSAHAVGGGARIDWERFLDGAESLADCMEIITEGLVDAVFGEVQKALKASVSATARPAANKVVASSFSGDAMAKMCGVVSAYGSGAVIFAPPEFIVAMGPDAIVPVPASGNYGGVYSPDDIENIHFTGYIKVFRGYPVVQIPQSYIDENNAKTWIDPQFAYVLPTGKDKVVKVVLEGETQIREHQNIDGSFEIFAYKKMGSAVLTHYNWGIYQNTGIPQTVDTLYGF